jgi:hyperosmotically inducible protein
MKSIEHRILNLTLACALSALAAAPALAGAAMPGFTSADGNGDGMISPEEFRAQGGHEQAFREGDANRDTRLDSGEYAMAVANNDRLKASKYVDDALITAKVKALLLKDTGARGFAVNVETHKGTVQLSGWVSSPEQAARAETIALGVAGVTAVRNDLQIKS